VISFSLVWTTWSQFARSHPPERRRHGYQYVDAVPWSPSCRFAVDVYIKRNHGS